MARSDFTGNEARDLSQLADAVQNMGAVSIVLDSETALTVIGNLQLALRHPLNRGASAKVVREVIDKLKAAFPAVVRPMLDRGDVPRYDV